MTFEIVLEEKLVEFIDMLCDDPSAGGNHVDFDMLKILIQRGEEVVVTHDKILGFLSVLEGKWGVIWDFIWILMDLQNF